MTPFELDVTKNSEAITIAVRGELDMATSKSLDEALKLANEQGPTKVVVDLTGLTFMDSTALGMMIAAHEQATSNGHALVIRHDPEGTVGRLFELTGVTEVFDDGTT